MATLTKALNGRHCATTRGLRLLERVRDRVRRNRNLAELRALDAGRLEDIGLSADARARIVG